MRSLIRGLIRWSGVLRELESDVSTLTWAALQDSERHNALALRVESLEEKRRVHAHPPAPTSDPDLWIAELWVGRSAVVRVALERDRGLTSTRRVTVTEVFSQSGRELPWGEIAATLRRLYDGAEVIIPRIEDISWEELCP
jgi:hypothetical protein